MIRRQLPNSVNSPLLDVEPVAQYFEFKTNQEFNSRMNVDCKRFKEKDVKRLLLFSTPRYGIPGEHRINQAGINSDKLLERLVKRQTAKSLNSRLIIRSRHTTSDQR